MHTCAHMQCTATRTTAHTYAAHVHVHACTCAHVHTRSLAPSRWSHPCSFLSGSHSAPSCMLDPLQGPALVTWGQHLPPQGSSQSAPTSPLRTVSLSCSQELASWATIHFFLQLRLKKKKSVCCHCSILVNDCGKGDPCPQGSVSLGKGLSLEGTKAFCIRFGKGD